MVDVTSDTTGSVDPRVARSRAKVLAAATAILTESGAKAVTVDAVAERSGVAKSTLYRHWDSHTALLVDVMRACMPETTDPDLAQGFESALRHVIGEYARLMADSEWQRALPAMLSLQHQIPEFKELTAGEHEEQTAVLRNVLQLGVAEGVLPAALDPDVAGLLLMGPLLFATLIENPLDDAETLTDFIVERFIASHRDQAR